MEIKALKSQHEEKYKTILIKPTSHSPFKKQKHECEPSKSMEKIVNGFNWMIYEKQTLFNQLQHLSQFRFDFILNV